MHAEICQIGVFLAPDKNTHLAERAVRWFGIIISTLHTGTRPNYQAAHASIKVPILKKIKARNECTVVSNQTIGSVGGEGKLWQPV